MSDQSKNEAVFLKSFAGASLGVIFGITLLLGCCMLCSCASTLLIAFSSTPENYPDYNYDYTNPYSAETIENLTTYSVGEVIEIGDLLFTVNDVSEYVSTDELFYPRSGYMYLKVDVTIENLDEMNSNYGSITEFSIQDSNGQYYYPLTSATLRTLPGNTLSRGERISGFITFEIPRGMTGYNLLYYGNYDTTKVSLTRG